MTSLERRIHKLEALINRLLPDIDIETALESTNTAAAAEPVFDRLISIDAAELPSPKQREELSEALPHEADGFDWREQASDIDYIADGMAALSVEPEGVGYLGMSPHACIRKAHESKARPRVWYFCGLSCTGPVTPMIFRLFQDSPVLPPKNATQSQQLPRYRSPQYRIS